MSGCNFGMIEDIDATKIASAFHSYQPDFFALVPRFYEVVEQKIMKTLSDKGVFIEKLFFVLFSISHFFYKFIGINIGNYLFKNIRSRVFGKNLTALGSGASVLKKSTMKFFLTLGISAWANFYALTETYVPAVVTGDFDHYPTGTVGRVDRFAGIDVKIHDPDTNGIGEIRIKTILIMKGYFRDPELTAAAFDKDGYFKTGDLGYIDKKYLYITGRIKEAILLHSGKKIAPSDVDSYYSDVMPDIKLASCGVPNNNSSYDEIHLFVENSDLTSDQEIVISKALKTHSGNTNSTYYISKIHFINKIPTTTIGKVKRFKLKEYVITGCTGE